MGSVVSWDKKTHPLSFPFISIHCGMLVSFRLARVLLFWILSLLSFP